VGAAAAVYAVNSAPLKAFKPSLRSCKYIYIYVYNHFMCVFVRTRITRFGPAKPFSGTHPPPTVFASPFSPPEMTTISQRRPGGGVARYIFITRYFIMTLRGFVEGKSKFREIR